MDTPSGQNGKRSPDYEDGDQIVISGISGAFPNCENVSELSEKLFAKENLITDLPDINFSVGKLKSLDKFDAQFFGISHEHAELMDPMGRILLEKTYEAIVDAGYNPIDFKGSNMAVYVANCTSETEMESMSRSDIKGALICERAQCFLANRISYWLGINGPSCTVNTACSSSLYAVEFAYKAIRNGECDAAIVGGSNLCLNSNMMRLYKNLGITSSRCRSFDDEAIGFCKSEAICVILIQKVKHARRMYAELVHIKTNNDGYKTQSILFPSSIMQAKLINEIYEECNIPKHQIAWVEAHGTGTRVGDYQEMNSLETLCENRSTPLLCGCVKSSTGHTESASGLCSIIKVIIAMESGLIPPNINFNKPQGGIKALQENRIKVITEVTPWDGGYVAVNNFGIGGSNAHALLKSNTKVLMPHDKNSTYLVNISGRTEKAVLSIIDQLFSTPFHVDFIKLLHQIHKYDIPQHMYRGYAIINENSSIKIKSVKRVQTSAKPVWYIYPGMGSQCLLMVKDLLRVPSFETSIRECHHILEPKMINLISILTSQSPSTFQNILNCFVGITSMMIALTDLLESIGIKPDGLIGHSFGEIGCAYADKCLNKVQALEVAYYRGIASIDMKTIRGSMAVIGLEGKVIEKMCPASVEVACYNGVNSCTISGSQTAIQQIVEKLNNENIFATEIFSSNTAYHSSHIKSGGSIYGKYLEGVITTPKERSNTWISTSTTNITHCSAEYFVNNFTKPVHFQNALNSIPKNAITIEISPHSILSTVLNSTLSNTITNISLMNKNQPDSILYLLKSLGRLYENEVDMDISQLYPKPHFPVSKGTPMIAPLVKWNHNDEWYVPYRDTKPNVNTPQTNGDSFLVSYNDEEYSYLQDYIVNDKNVYPESGYLEMVWKSLSRRYGLDYRNVSIVFRKVKFQKTVQIPGSGSLCFNVTITKKGQFEITLDDEIVVDGYVEITHNEAKHSDSQEKPKEDIYTLNVNDIYKEFRIKGYNYKNYFRTIMSCNIEGTEGKVLNSKKWILYLNSMLQFVYLRRSTKTYLVEVSEIEVVEINVVKQREYAKLFKKGIPIILMNNDVSCGGARLRNVKTKMVQREPCKKPTLQTFHFVPYIHDKILSTEDLVRTLMTLVFDNNQTHKINILEFPNYNSNCSILSKEIDLFLQEMTFYKADISIYPNNINDSLNVPSNFKVLNANLNKFPNSHLIILPTYKDNIQKLVDSSLLDNAFIVTRETCAESLELTTELHGLKICAMYNLQQEKLFIWRQTLNNRSDTETVSLDSHNWISSLQHIIETNTSKKVIVYSENNNSSGLLGFYKCIRKESHGHKMRCVLVSDNAPQFTPEEMFYQNQLQFDLALNIYKQGHWGFYAPFRVKPLANVVSPHVYLTVQDLKHEKHICWTKGEIGIENIQKNEEIRCKLIQVQFVTMSHKHLESKIPIQDSTNSYEFSGTDAYSNKVMGISFSRSISNLLPPEKYIHWIIPHTWSLRDAVMLPKAYLTALLVFETISKESKKIILIRNGHSSIGQALIQIASQYQCTVYTIEDTEERSNFVETFSQVKSFGSNEESFANLKKTLNGHEVDILVLDTFENAIEGLLGFIKNDGQIVYTGNETSTKLETIEKSINNGVYFRSVNLENFMLQKSPQLNGLKKRFKAAIENGHIKPILNEKTQIQIPCTLKKCEKQSSTLIVEIFPKTSISTGKSQVFLYEALPRYNCSSAGTYIICGGLGGMGFELADWLISRGATKLVLVSRTGNCDGYRVNQLAKWRKQGAYILISTDDITTEAGVRNLFENANRMGKVVAIFNTTLILQDALFQSQTVDTFEAVKNPKATATIYLDRISRSMCPYLENFVVFSSIVCGYGNAGQSNYGYANSVMEQVCEIRKRENLPALAIEWAGVADVGYLENVDNTKMPSGTLLQPMYSCLEVLDYFLCQTDCIVSSFIVSHLRSSVNSDSESIFACVKKIVDTSNIEILKDTTLKEIGLDSIAATEVKNILQQHYSVSMAISDIYNLPVHDLWNIETRQQAQTTNLKIPIKHLSILEEMYKNLFTILEKETDIFNLPSMVRLDSYLADGSKIGAPMYNKNTIFMLPGIEGFAATMEPLSQNLDLQVLCAQYDVRESSIAAIVEKLLPKFEHYLGNEKEFHIIGHSFGGLIALEIAHALERKHKSGYLYLVDSSPATVKWISNTLFKTNGFYSNIVGFVRALNVEINIEKFTEELQHIQEYTSAVEFTMKSLPNNTTFSKNLLKTVLNMSYQRSVNIDLYEGIPKGSLTSQIFFFEPKESVLQDPPDHRLSEYCCTPVKEFVTNGNHFTMLKTTTLAHYIRTTFREAVNNR